MSLIDNAPAIGEPAPDELEALFVNNADLEKLKAYFNRFNPIRVMRAADKELRHSAIFISGGAKFGHGSGGMVPLRAA